MPEVVVDNTAEFADWRKQLIVNDNNRPLDLRENAYLILKHHPAWKERVQFDEFAQRVVIEKPPDIPGFPPGEWTLQHDLNFGLWSAQVMKCWYKGEKTIAQGVMMAALERRFNPLQAWLDSLVWDREPRLAHWLSDCLGVERTEYAMKVGAYFVLNLVARAYAPGCICRSVVIFEGEQNRGKSECFRALAQPWFADTHLDLGNKDSFLQLQGVWLYEIPEMHAFSKADINRVKEFVSSREDNYRPPYAARVARVARRAVFGGTTNEQVYLRDWTGGTRFWPVLTGVECDVDAAKVAGVREQLFAEAVALHRLQEPRHPSREEEERLFKPQQEERELQHPWQRQIYRFLYGSNSDIWGPKERDKVTVGEILGSCLKLEAGKLTEEMQRTVGRIMQRLQWPRLRDTTGEREWFYYRPASQALEERRRGARPERPKAK